MGTTEHHARILLDRVEDLAVFPPAAERVLFVAQSPRSTVRDMERALEGDPVLAAHVVALANSALYGRGTGVTDLGRAVQLLGFDLTRDTAVALALSSVGDRVDPRLAPLWHHAQQTARAARALAPFVDATTARRAFLVALLHDIGRQLMALVDPDAMADVLRAESGGHRDVRSLERQHFGIDHAELGGECLRRWGFPSALVDAVADHHKPAARLPGRLVAQVQLADALAHALEATEQVEGLLTIVASEPSRRVLGVTRDALRIVVTELLRRWDQGLFAA